MNKQDDHDKHSRLQQARDRLRMMAHKQDIHWDDLPVAERRKVLDHIPGNPTKWSEIRPVIVRLIHASIADLPLILEREKQGGKEFFSFRIVSAFGHDWKRLTGEQGFFVMRAISSLIGSIQSKHHGRTSLAGKWQDLYVPKTMLESGAQGIYHPACSVCDKLECRKPSVEHRAENLCKGGWCV